MVYECITNPSSIDSPSLQELNEQRKYYRYDLYGQREFVWTLKKKQKLVLSLFQNIKPLIITANINGESIEIIDGQQRLNTVFSFLNNEISLPEDTILKINNTEYDISNMKFEELPQELKILLLSKNMRIEKYINLSDKQANEIMQRVNNGQQFTPIEIARMENYGSIGNFIEEIKETDLFKRKIAIAETFKKKLLDERLLIAIFALECNLNEISFSNVEEISKQIREENLLTDEIRKEILDTINYMDNMIPAKQKWLNTNNFIPIYRVCKILMKDNIDNRIAFRMLESFFMNGNEKYNSIKSNKWSSKSVSEKRYEILKEHIDNISHNKEELA